MTFNIARYDTQSFNSLSKSVKCQYLELLHKVQSIKINMAEICIKFYLFLHIIQIYSNLFVEYKSKIKPTAILSSLDIIFKSS